MKKILTLAVVLAMIMTVVVIPASAESYKVGLSMDDLNTEFWKGNYDAMYARAKEKDVEIVEVIAGGDANKQNEQISDLIAKGCKVIIIAAADSASIVSAIDECADAGVKTIMDNRSCPDGTPDATVVADNEKMAYDEMTWLINYAKEKGITFNNAVMLIGDLGDENAIQRKNGFSKAIEENPGVVNVCVEVPTEWDQEVALAGLQNALQANPDIDLIITPSDFLWTPIQSALEQAGKWAKIGEENHVAVISFDGDVNGMQMMKDGYNWANAAQGAVEEGYMCIDIALKYLTGEEVEESEMIDPGIVCNLDNFEEVKESIWGWAGVK